MSLHLLETQDPNQGLAPIMPVSPEAARLAESLLVCAAKAAKDKDGMAVAYRMPFCLAVAMANMLIDGAAA